MRETTKDLANWPKRRNGQPILKTSNEALLYAQLVYNDISKQQNLTTFRDEAYAKLRVERERMKPNPQRMMDLAVQAQLFRESFIHTLRILNEINPTNGG